MSVYGQAFIWGAQSPKPLSNVPPDALKVRLRLRAESVGLAFVKFADRVEKWILMPSDGQTRACPTWKLGILQGVNQVNKTYTVDFENAKFVGYSDLPMLRMGDLERSPFGGPWTKVK